MLLLEFKSNQESNALQPSHQIQLKPGRQSFCAGSFSTYNIDAVCTYA